MATNMMKEKKNFLDESTEKELNKLLDVENGFKENKIDWFRAFEFGEVGEYLS